MKSLRTGAIAGMLLLVLFFPGQTVKMICLLFLFTELFAFVYSGIVRRGIRVRRSLRELRVARYDRLELVLFAENASFLPLTVCFITDRPGVLSISAEDGRALFRLRPHETVTFRYSIRGTERGTFNVGPLAVAGSDPLGLYPFEVEIPEYSRVTVHPARADIVPFLRDGIPQGNLRVRNPVYEDVTLYRSVREYVPGDELKRVNWKVSARLSSLFTNEYQNSMLVPAFVFLNLCIDDYADRQRYQVAESAIELAAALISRLAALRQKTGFASTGIMPAAGVKPFLPLSGSSSPLLAGSAAILDILAAIRMSPGSITNSSDAERAYASVPAGGCFFYVGPQSGEEKIREMTRLFAKPVQTAYFFCRIPS